MKLMLDRRLIGFALAICVCASPGCQKAAPDTSAVEKLSTLTYPEDAGYGDDLDVIVVPTDSAVRLANRTPHAFNNVQVWLNQQYVSEVDRIDIGTGNVLPLSGFINYYQESFPRGTFLRPRRGDKVVLAEVYDPDKQLRHRMVVQPDYPKSLFNPLD